MKFSELEYRRPDCEALIRKMDQITHVIETAGVDIRQIVEKIIEANELRKTYHSQQTLARIRHSIDSQDKFYQEEQNFFDETDPKVQDAVVRFYAAICATQGQEKIEARFGKEFLVTAKNSSKTSSPAVVPLLEEENRLVSEYQQLLATVKVTFDGNQYNLSEMSRFHQSADRQTRKSANLATAETLLGLRPKFDQLYSQLVETRVKIASDLGYSNFIDLTYDRMNRSGYRQKDVATFREAILNNIVPIATELIEEQRQRLGLEKLKFYDLALSYPEGNPKPEGTFDEQISAASKMYQELSAETGEFWKFMRDHELMDLPTRPGKFPGGYATLMYDQKMPFIFANFNGTADDIGVLTHEVGHTFQAFCSRDFELLEDVWPTLEACEIHSESMEFLTWPWMHLFFGSRVDQFKYDAVSRLLRFLPYAACVDHFQEEVYLNPQLTPEERRLVWRRLEKLYLPHKDYDGVEYYESGSFWFIQRHIFANPFYYIDYALARVCALQFWEESERNYAGAWKRYLELCKLGGSKNFFELVQSSGLNSPFEPSTLKQVTDFSRQWLAKSPYSGVNAKKQ